MTNHHDETDSPSLPDAEERAFSDSVYRKLLDTAPDLVGALNRLRIEDGLPALDYARLRPAASHGSDALLRAGALRFWISRLWNYYLPREASMLTPHDPSHFERVLRQRARHPVTL